jgi:hypothetical protein
MAIDKWIVNKIGLEVFLQAYFQRELYCELSKYIAIFK